MKLNKNIVINGQLIKLRPPNIQKDIYESSWADWFNDKNITKYLNWGDDYNTPELEEQFVKKQLALANKLLLAIVLPATDKIIGVINLTNVNFESKTSEIAIVMGYEKYPPGAPLEAMGLLTSYCFEKLKLNKIKAGQDIGLWKWINLLELIGYKLEGYQKGNWVKNGLIRDTVLTTILKEDYFKIKEERNGNYIPADMLSFMKTRRQENLCQKIKKAIENIYSEGQL